MELLTSPLPAVVLAGWQEFWIHRSTHKIRAFWLFGQQLAERFPEESHLAGMPEAAGNELPPLDMLQLMWRFYSWYPVWQEAYEHLRWPHFRMLLRIAQPEKRQFYLEVCSRESWSVKELARNVKARYYERYLEAPPMDMGDRWRQCYARSPVAWLKDPLVLEFLNLGASPAFLERALEDALMAQLPPFLKELGPGFSFAARQKRLTTFTGREFYVDLVFYHFLARRFVLIDLKAGELTHRDIGQMDMYVRMYDALHRAPEDGPTLGIILCASKDESLVRYSQLHSRERLFAITYQLTLPSGR